MLQNLMTQTMFPIIASLLLGSLLTACSDASDEQEPATADRNETSDDTAALESAVEVDDLGRTEGTDGSAMKVWADTYAADLGVPEFPGFVDLWWPYGGDIDGDGDIDSIGSFGMSAGGNSVGSYIAVFITEGDSLRFDAVVDYGYTGSRAVQDITSISDGRISATTLLWTDDDAHCCPSDSGTVVFGWEPGSLVVVE